MADLFSRMSEGLVLPTSISSEVWEKATEDSTVMRLATRTDLPALGTTIAVTGDAPEAAWVNEGAKKAAVSSTFDSRQMGAYKAACILLFTNEFRRDAAGMYASLIRRLPTALAKNFDRTVYGYKAAPGEHFGRLNTATAKVLHDPATYADTVDVLRTLASHDGGLSTWVLGTAGEIALLGAVDTTGRPLFTPGGGVMGGIGSIGALHGRPVVATKYVTDRPNPTNTIGFAGDWVNDARYGIAENITVRMSTEASIVDSAGVRHDLFQENKFAVLIEHTVGFQTTDPARFVRLTSAPVTP